MKKPGVRRLCAWLGVVAMPSRSGKFGLKQAAGKQFSESAVTEQAIEVFSQLLSP
jgi:hypothetical protein